MSSPSRVSVVIPTYNYASFVGRAIESVLWQSYAPIECIVVDDGSTDETAPVLERYRHRVQIIRIPNRGVSQARNEGIRAARGSLVAFLDSDDWWRPEKIATQVRFLDANPAVAVVGCGVAVADPCGNIRGEFPGRRSSRSRRRDFQGVALRRSWVMGSASGALIRRSALEEVGLFNSCLAAAEDWDLWLRVAARFQFDNVPDVLVTLSQHGTGVFRNPHLVADCQWLVYRHAVSTWPRDLDWTVRAQMRALIAADMSGEYIAAGAVGPAVRHLASAAAHWPFDRRHWWRFVHIVRRSCQQAWRSSHPTLARGPGH